MMPMAKKPSLVLAVKLGKKPSGPEGGDEEEAPEEEKAEGDGYEPNEDQEAAGSDLGEALKSGDGAAIAKAFMALKELC